MDERIVPGILIVVGVYVLYRMLRWVIRKNKASKNKLEEYANEFIEYSYDVASHYIHFMEGMIVSENPKYIFQKLKYDIVEIHEQVLQAFIKNGITSVSAAFAFIKGAPLWFSEKYKRNYRLPVEEWMKLEENNGDMEEHTQPQ